MESVIKGVGALVVLALLIMGACIIVQQHAIERHGLSAVEQTRQMMDNCQNYDSVEFTDGKRFILAILFPGKKGCFQVTTGEHDDPASREITTVPQGHIRDIRSVVRGWVERRGYRVNRTWGEMPEWLMKLLEAE